IRQMLISKELDLGVIHCSEIPESLSTERLITTQMVAAVSPDNPLAKEKSIDFDTFFKQELVMFKAGYFHREYIDRICEEYNYQPQIAFETNLLPMILRIVRNDFAIAALLDM
ncbi:LysR family transcriptional regulator substrate-binding protein, partial [Photobacterium sanctipauli]